MKVAWPVASLVVAILAESAWILADGGTDRLPGDVLPALAGGVGLSIGVPLCLGALLALAGQGSRRPRVARFAAALAPGLLVGATVVGLLDGLDRGWGPAAALCGVSVGVGILGTWRAWTSPVLLVAAVATLPLRAPHRPGSAPPSGDPTGDARIVLVTLDTFRADHTGCIGGYRRPVSTPRLDGLASTGTLYRTAISEVPLTLPSHTTLLTGVPSWQAGVFRNGGVLAPEVSPVAARLHDAGYATAAFVSSRVLPDTSGLDRGFDPYDDGLSTWNRVLGFTLPRALARAGVLPRPAFDRPADATVARALAWLDGQDRPFFLWIHLYDPHSPYAPPAPWDTAYDASAPDAPGNPDEIVPPPGRFGRMSLLLMPRDLRKFVARYAGEISWTDTQLGRIVDDLPPDATLVVVGDHGESLTEHGYYLNHGASVHEPSLRVPLVVRSPRNPAGSVVDAPTSLLRVAPTLLAAGGLPAGGPTLLDAPEEGWILSFAPAQQARVSLPTASTWRVAWRRGDEKWIVDGKGNVERYDLATDPGESHNTASESPEEAAFREKGLAFIEELKAAGPNAEQPLSAETREALQALGYMD